LATVAWLQSHIQSSKQENVTFNASKAAKKVLSACKLHKLMNYLVTLCYSIYVFYDIQPVTKVNTAADITYEGKDAVLIKLALLQCFYLKKCLQTELILNFSPSGRR